MSVLTRSQGDRSATERRTRRADDSMVARDGVSAPRGYGYEDESMAAGPWRRGDAVRLWAMVGIGLAILVISWAVAADTAKFSQQMTCVALAVLGVVITVFGGVTWLRRALAVVGKERRCLRQELAAIYGSTVAPDTERRSALVFGEGMRRYHRTDCDVVSGKAVRVIDRAAAQQAGLVHCEMCGS